MDNIVIKFRSQVCLLIHDLTVLHYRKDGSRVPALTQKEIGSLIGLTPASMSRVATGVSTINAVAYYRLCELHKQYCDED